jgi:hypothetical protein
VSPIPPPNLAPPFDPERDNPWYSPAVQYYYDHIKTKGAADQEGGQNMKGGAGHGSPEAGRATQNEEQQVDWSKGGIFGPEELGLKSTELTSKGVRPIIEIVTSMDDFLRRGTEIGKTLLEKKGANATSSEAQQIPSLNNKKPDSVTVLRRINPQSINDTRTKVIRVPVTQTH